MRKLSAFFIAFFVVCSLIAQVDVKFTGSNFPGKSEQLSIAKKQIKNADIFVFTENSYNFV